MGSTLTKIFPRGKNSVHGLRKSWMESIKSLSHWHAQWILQWHWMLLWSAHLPLACSSLHYSCKAPHPAISITFAGIFHQLLLHILIIKKKIIWFLTWPSVNPSWPNFGLRSDVGNQWHRSSRTSTTSKNHIICVNCVQTIKHLSFRILCTFLNFES